MKQSTVAVNGACGRMGRLLVAGIAGSPQWRLVAALGNPAGRHFGEDAGTVAGAGPVGVAVGDGLPDADVVIDFSTPAASMAVVGQCADRGIPVLVATTGFDDDQRQRLTDAAGRTAVLVASNTSLVVNLMMSLAGRAGAVLRGKDFDVELVERHHRHKQDAPSGTALRLAEIVRDAMDLDEPTFGRHGLTGARPRGQLGVHAVRGGDYVGEHTLIFAAPGETLELVHRGTSRDSYVQGALAAAAFLVGKPPGSYGMADVLGLD